MKIFGTTIPEVFREGAIAVGVERVMKLIDGAVEKNGAEIVGKVMIRIVDDHRVQFWSAVGNLDDAVAIENIHEAYRRAKDSLRANDEDRWMNIMARVYLALRENPEELDRFLKEMGHMTPDEFGDTLTALENDVIAQWFLRARQLTGEVLGSTWKGAVKAAKAADDKLEPVANALEDVVEKRARQHFR